MSYMLETSPKENLKLILEKIIENKKREIEILKREVPLEKLKEKLKDLKPTRDFKGAISKQGKINLIAEIKRKSPSQGEICKDFNPLKIAKVYEKEGASAISILTDKEFFGGDISLLSQVKEITTIPILRKEFIIDEYQIYQSRVWGADAILIIAKILREEEFNYFLTLAHNLNMHCLIEVHTEEELAKVLRTGGEIIGINNRNLSTLNIDLSLSLHLIKKIPQDRIVVSESGIETREEINLLEKNGFKAVLVGESLLRSKDIGLKIKELLGNG